MEKTTNQQTHQDKCRLTRKAIHLSMVLLNRTLKQLQTKLELTADGISANAGRIWDKSMVVLDREKQPKLKRSALETIQWRTRDTAEDCKKLSELSEGIIALRVFRQDLLVLAETNDEDILHHLSYMFGFLPYECRNTKHEPTKEQIGKILNTIARYALNQKETNLHFDDSQPLYCYQEKGDGVSAIKQLAKD